MPPPLTPQQEIELKLRDSVSATLKQVGQNLEEIKRKAKELGTDGSKSLGQLLKDSDEANKTAAAWSSSITSMHGVFTTIGRNLAGPFGVAAGLYAVGKALENFNLKTLELSHVSVNTQLSLDNILKLRQAAYRSIGDVQGSLEQVQNVANAVENLRLNNSWFYDFLVDIGRKSLADSMRHSVLAGQSMDGVTKFYDDFGRESGHFQDVMAGAVGADRAMLLQASANLKKHVTERHRSVQSAREYNVRWVSATNRFNNAANQLAIKILHAFRGPKAKFEELKNTLSATAPGANAPAVPPQRAPSGRHIAPSPPAPVGRAGRAGGPFDRPITERIGGDRGGVLFSDAQRREMERYFAPSGRAGGPFDRRITERSGGDRSGALFSDAQRREMDRYFAPSGTVGGPFDRRITERSGGDRSGALFSDAQRREMDRYFAPSGRVGGPFDRNITERPGGDRSGALFSDVQRRGMERYFAPSGTVGGPFDRRITERPGGDRSGALFSDAQRRGMESYFAPSGTVGGPFDFSPTRDRGAVVSDRLRGDLGRYFLPTGKAGGPFDYPGAGRPGVVSPPEYMTSRGRSSTRHTIEGGRVAAPGAEEIGSLQQLPPIPGPDYVSSGHRGSGEGGPAGPYSRGGRSDAGHTGGSWGRFGSLPPIPGPDYATSAHLGGAQPGPGTTSAWSSGRTMEYGNLPPIPGPEYMWGHRGRSDTRHTMGGGGREGFGISDSLINSRSSIGAPDLMRRFGSGAYTRYHTASNEGFAGPTGPGAAAGGMMMPPGLDFSKLGTMELPPTSADQLGKGGPTASPEGSLMGHALGSSVPYGGNKSWFQRLKERIFGAGAEGTLETASYTTSDRLQLAEETSKSLIDISGILHRMEEKGGAPGFPQFGGADKGSGGAGATGDFGRGPHFRRGIGPGARGTRGGPGLLGPSGVSSEQAQKELAISSGEWDAYRQGMADIESSGGKYGLTGGSSGRFSGAYQFGAQEIADTARRLGESPPTRQQFLSDPAMQERFMTSYTMQHHQELMQHPKYAAMTPREKLAVLGYAHNQGVGSRARGTGAMGYLDSGRAGRDAFGTSGATYGTSIRRRLSELDSGGRPGSGLVKSGPPGETDNLPAHIVQEAQRAALTGGGPAVKRFMADNGYVNHGEAWCGEFAASVVRAAGGSPPANPAIASNWRLWGTPTSTPVPGDIAVRRGVRTGSTGSHVTTVETGIDPETGRFGSIGGNQGAMRQSMPASRYEFRHAPEGPEERKARQLLNLDYRQSEVPPKTNIKIVVKDTPKGARVNHDVDGDNVGAVTVSKSKAPEAVFNLPSGI